MAEMTDFIWIRVRAIPTKTPGIYLHRKIEEDKFSTTMWTVTHQSSGLIVAEFHIKRKALEFANRLGNGKVDWTLDEEGLKEYYDWDKLAAAIKKLKDEIDGKFPQVDEDEAPF